MVRVRSRLLLLLASLALAGAASASSTVAPRPRAPAGYRVELFARGLSHPTAMAFGPDGRLYVTQDTGGLVSLRAGARVPGVLLRGLATPLGLAWLGNRLYVSTQGRLLAYMLRGGKLVGARTILAHLPFGEHQADNVVAGKDGRLYLGIASTCDVCREKSPRSATILSLRPDGSGVRVEATGLRNPYGLAFGPDGALYATVNGADHLDRRGDPEPAEMLVRVKRGADYGWPGCFPSARTVRMSGVCRGVTPPVAFLEPHSSADGVVFWRGDAFVAEWGTYYGTRFGRRVVRVHLGSDGRAGAKGVTVFATGIAHPLALAVEPRGGLLVADWQTGRILRIHATGQP
jgi:glucose/arabinose dehydrogenase